MDIASPITDAITGKLKAGDMITVSGDIYCGRDTVLPKLTALPGDEYRALGIDLKGSVIFHTAVSPAGVGPTSSNKEEIENSFEPLCAAGVKLFLGKGKPGPETVATLDRYGAVFAVVPPVTALLGDKTTEHEVIAFPELGMEAFHRLKVEAIPAIVAVAHGKTIFRKEESSDA